MASLHGHLKNGKSSIKYQWVSLDVQTYEPNTNFPHKDAHIACANDHVESQIKFPTVSAAKSLSAIDRVWQYVGNLADFQNDESLKIHHDDSLKENSICYSDKKRYKPTSARNDNSSTGLQSRIFSLSTVGSNFEELHCIKSKVIFTAYSGDVVNSYIWKHVLLSGSQLHIGNYKAELNPTPAQVNSLDDLKDVTNHRFVETAEKPPVKESTSEADGHHVSSEDYDSCDKSNNLVGKDLQIPGSFSSAYSFLPMTARKISNVGFRNHGYSLYFSYNFDFLTLTDCTNGQYQPYATITCSSVAEISEELSTSNDNNTCENDKNLSQDLFHGCFTIQDKLQNVLVKNRHAIAGALAGTMVSLCLHPIDTIKTVIQADAISQKSVYSTFRTIISEKGISGLYRGVATNIASSAPISAIYTLTYESVKGGLLPILPKEHHFIAHCIAGGCSSIATSVVFTPSERIKQQMQVGLQYQNCWNAFIGCLEKGGLPSLYTGWRAVLSRNIPHSVLKFYIYESLRQLLLTSAKPDEGLNTFQTLLCGGIAGSTAASFTTPFDVIKTKLQTQAPGTLGKYNGVFHALQEIAREEGLQGLYRGLIPRLAMYISQGAIFFASYEFLKEVLAVEVPRSPAQSIHNKRNAEGSTSKVNKLHS